MAVDLGTRTTTTTAPLGFPSGEPIIAVEEARRGRRRESPVLAQRGMIAAAHPLVAASGLRVLREGGNAVDAAIAAAFTATVVLPAMCGLGGDLFAVVHRPAKAGEAGGGETVAVHGSGIAPRGASLAFMREHGERDGTIMPQQGPLSPAVPGFVDGAFALLDRFGSRPAPDLAADAIAYAADGVPLSPRVAFWIAESQELLARNPAAAAVFLPGGVAPAAGSILRQSDVARTLMEVAAGGPDLFYRGELAARIGRDLAEVGGALAAGDFADQATDISAPIRTTYRDHTVYQTGLPTQGFVVLEALNIVAASGLDPAALRATDAEGVHTLVEAVKLAFADRLAYAGDPRTVDDPLATLLSPEWAADRAARIDRDRALDETAPGELRPGDTTSLSVIDGDGLMVSLIFSLSAGFGSGVIAGDTGVLLNNRAGHCFSLVEGHPNLYAPGKKPMHTLNCYLVADPSGTPVLVGNTPGGDAQPQWNLQTLSGLIDAGLDAQAAVEQPRWTLWPGTYPAEVGNPYELSVEDRLGDAAIAALERRGHRVSRVGAWGAGGSVQVIARDPETGTLCAGSDPRSEGLAIGF